MEDNVQRQRESISLTPMALGVENMGAEFLESLEEGRLPGSSDSSQQGGHAVERKPPWGWRGLHWALQGRPRPLFRWMGTALLCTAYAAFLLTACLLDFQRALALSIVTCVVLAFLAHSLLKKCLGPTLRECVTLQGHPHLRIWFNRALALAAVLALALWLGLDTSQRPEQLVSFAGICVLISILFACSKHHRAVSWRTVSWGLGLQFVLGLFIIRTEPGFIAFQWLGDQIRIFLSYAAAGSSFVFGEALVKATFAFQVLPIIVFFSCVMSVLYYLGLMQWVILKIAWLMQITMGTSATETLSVAGNIFVSQTEAPLLIQPYLADMTLSEIHVVMTGGYATIAGSLLGAYISFGVDASSLIAASVMAAPGALALSKLVYPEVEEAKIRSEEGVRLSYGDAQNLVEALSSGAATSVRVVANIAANLIAFLAVLAFINAALSWLGTLVDVPGLSFQGLSEYKRRRLAGAEEWIGARKQWISVRAETLATFALCGFANVSSIGIMLGGLSILYAPRGPEAACGGLLNRTLSSSSFEVYQCCRRAFQSTSLEFSPAARDNCCRFYNHTVCG
uniref:Solute carrier family 28 member 1 n=1 Tax=Chinchilla lanigera TaxID=34839 RepID=A0A8C2YN46_CHILA